MFVLLSFLLILSCEQPVGGGVKQPKTGYVTLSLAGVTNGAEARTIMPTTPTPADFKSFRLWFIKYDTKEATIVYRTLANLEEPITLEIGEYELTVTAYLDTLNTQPAAHTELKGANRIVISKGMGEKCVITLNAITADTGMVIDDPRVTTRPPKACSAGSSRVTLSNLRLAAP